MSSGNDKPKRTKRKVQVVVFTRNPELQVLILRRPPERGHIWQPVTGNVDETDVSLASAARRELAEETGIEDPLTVTDTGFDFRFRKGRADVVERLIGVETDGPVPVALSREHVEYAWVPPHEAGVRFEWDLNRQGLRRVIDAVSDGRSTP